MVQYYVKHENHVFAELQHNLNRATIHLLFSEIFYFEEYLDLHFDILFLKYRNRA